MKSHEDLIREGWQRCTPGNRPKEGYVSLLNPERKAWSTPIWRSEDESLDTHWGADSLHGRAAYFKVCDSAGNPLVKPLRLEVGKRYVMRSGEITLPLERNKLDPTEKTGYLFSFSVSIGVTGIYTYTSGGRRYGWREDKTDLISEYTEPAAKVDARTAEAPKVSEAAIQTAIAQAKKWEGPSSIDVTKCRVCGAPIHRPHDWWCKLNQKAPHVSLSAPGAMARACALPYDRRPERDLAAFPQGVL